MLITFAHVEGGARILQMLFNRLGSRYLDTVHPIGELRLHVEHLHRSKVFLQLFSIGIEQTDLFSNQTSYYQSGFYARESTSLYDEGLVSDNGLPQGLPFHIRHPRNHVARLSLRHLRQHSLYLP